MGTSVVDSARIGELTAEFDGQQLNILCPTGEKNLVTISIREIYDLFDFINSYNPVDINKRLAFRVPIFSSRSLGVHLVEGLSLFEARAINISMNGILVSIPDESRELELHQPVEVILSHDSKNIKVQGEIRSIRDRFFGIHFTNSVKNGELDPSDEITGLVMKLQRTWLANRASR